MPMSRLRFYNKKRVLDGAELHLHGCAIAHGMTAGVAKPTLAPYAFFLQDGSFQFPQLIWAGFNPGGGANRQRQHTSLACMACTFSPAVQPE